MNQRLYATWLGDVFFCFSGEISEMKVDAWVAVMRRMQPIPGTRPFKQAALRIAELRWPAVLRHGGGRRSERKALTGRGMEGLALSPKDTWDLLLHYSAEAMAAQGIEPGPELSYWREAAKFALELLSRGRIVPGALPAPLPSGRRRGNSGALKAVWCPRLDDPEDEARFRLLASAMPPLGLAPVLPAAEEELQLVETRQLKVLYSFITAMIHVETEEAVRALGRKLNPARANYIRGTSPLSELWWNSLLGAAPPADIQGPATEIHELMEGLSAAFGSAPQVESEGEAPASAGFRLCLRLEPIEQQEGSLSWRLSFWAEGAEDASLLVPAGVIWNEPHTEVTYRGKVYRGIQENLLLRLYKAAEIAPEIRDAMQAPRPESVVLQAEEVYRFLSRSVPALRKNGVTVQMPSRWTREGRRKAGIKLKAEGWERQSSAKRQPELGMRELVKFEVEAVLGGMALSAAELSELASAKSPLVLFRGEWIEIDAKEIRQVLRQMKKQEQGSMTFAELMHLTAGDEDAELWEGLHLAGIEVQGHLASLMQGDSLRSAPPRPIPPALHGTLRPYQERGFQWLAAMRDMGFGALLADDMGLGKTVQVITTVLDREKRSAPCLIVCPTSLLGNWQRELQRFAPQLKVYVHHGTNRLHGEAFEEAWRSCDVVLTTYQLAGRDAGELRQPEWSTIVLDEAQYIKNFGTKQAQSVMKLNSSHRIAMTGTPVENRLSELWSIFQFLNPGYLGSSAAFRRKYGTSGDHQQEELAKLRRLVAPFLLRRLKSDPDIRKDLPEKIELKSYCSLTAEQAGMYRSVTEELMSRIDDSTGIARKGLVLSSLTRLKQICDHPALANPGRPSEVQRSGKLERLLEILDTVMENGEAVLIFTQYVKMGELLVPHIRERYNEEPFFLHGGISKAERDAMVTSFQKGSGPRIFVLSLKAGGVGLNLTRANHVIHYDRWWNPAVENQATDRVFRIGQEKNVEVHKLICQGTLEERIDELIERKKSLSEQVVGSGEQWLTEMSTDELQQLITLQYSDWSM
ncbi:ATP-dependent helicase [Paenibacillus sp. CAA11]|uniref:DEAD/DEAH box helicase n=1 Tax=Paenibacillus sp. CAA11 TaxID=1532905 RepID=UPI000D3B31E8|nr:DEAD/DEAH box helicase [Paenibacillus sp. CAA11]AWB43258.1 ATP-dependent helicase [Paenibacillus sp. CAA11]